MADRNLAVSKIKGLLHAPRLGGGGGGGGEEPTPTANSKFDGSPTAAAADRRGRGSASYYSFNNGTTDGAGSSRSTPRSVRGDFSHGDDMPHGASAVERPGNDWWSQRGGRTRSSSRSTTRSSARGGGAGSTSRRNRHRENRTGCVAVGSVNRKMPTLWHSATAPPHGLSIAAPPISYRSSPSRPQTWRTTQTTEEASGADQSSAYPLTCSRLNEHDNLRSQQDGDEASQLDADKWMWNPINKYRQRLHGGGEDDGSGRGGDCAMSACSGASQCTMSACSGIASIRTQASSLRQQLKPSSHSFPALMSMVPFTPQFSPPQPGSARSC
eukprot:GHVU01092014.1.p1 GENE.GHVU01092014.1~~GHVU01092014.1.p1  ORF type:complete len:327 (+),score=32.06 GHVU01092014.1:2-982(+)